MRLVTLSVDPPTLTPQPPQLPTVPTKSVSSDGRETSELSEILTGGLGGESTRRDVSWAVGQW